MKFSRETTVTFADKAGLKHHADPAAVTHVVVILLEAPTNTPVPPREAVTKFVTDIYKLTNPVMWEAICKSNPNRVRTELIASDMKRGGEALLASPELVLARVSVPERATMVVQERAINCSGHNAAALIVTVSAEGDDPLRLLLLEKSEVRPAISVTKRTSRTDTTVKKWWQLWK